jgi:hypothetical protein
MGRFKHIIENELTHEVVVKQDLDEIKKDLSDFVEGLPADGVYSLTIVDNLTRETIYYTR